MSDDDDLVDTRTKAQKKGDTGKGAWVSIVQPNPPKNTRDNAHAAAIRAKRNAAKELVLDYTQMAILKAVDMLENSPSENAKTEAIKLILLYGLGRPQIVHVDEDGSQVTPHFTISFGEAQTIDYKIKDLEDADEENSE